MVFLSKKTSIVIFLIIFLFASFGFGVWYGSTQLNQQYYQPENLDFSLFWETYYMLKEKYVDQDKFNNKKLIYGAISGMVKSLEDPYTIFMPPEESKRFQEDVKGSFEGVGMEIGIRKERLQVISPLEGTPAKKAGVRAGDQILKIDGKDTVDMSVEEAVSLIRGQKGTEVTLTVYRSDWEESRDIKITRSVIEVPSLKLEMLASPGEAGGKDNGIAYIRIYQFSEKASDDFRKASLEILDSDSQKIILDLRDNPGGYLEVAQDIAGWFLERDQVVTIEDFGKDKEQKFYRANGNAKLLSYPIIILINQGSASGSEILAGALRDNRGIKLLGETSFGKGSVQQVEELREGSLKITIAKWLTPKGESISEKGLDPDIKVEMTAQDYDLEKDPQLDQAIELIKEMR